MEEPLITDFSRPLPASERADLVPVNFAEYQLIFGLTSVIYGPENPLGGPIPTSIGRWVAEVETADKDLARNLSSASKEKESFSKGEAEVEQQDEDGESEDGDFYDKSEGIVTKELIDCKSVINP